MNARAVVAAVVAVVVLVTGGSAAGGSVGGSAGASARSDVASRSVAPDSAADSLLGIDVSAYQHGVDWHEVAGAGASFAYIKATEGDSYTNARLHDQYGQAKRAGLVRGAFHFAKPNVSTPEAQAEYFIASLAELGGGRVDGTSTLPPLLDLEYDPYVRTDKTNSCWGLTPQQMRLWISKFSDTVIALTGRVPAIYTTTDWWQLCTGDSTDSSASPLFVARYVSDPAVADPAVADPAAGPGELPSGWTHWTMWQYTNKGSTFAGVTDSSKGDVPALDEDFFRGSAADLRALARRTFTAGADLQPAPGRLLPAG